MTKDEVREEIKTGVREKVNMTDRERIVLEDVYSEVEDLRADGPEAILTMIRVVNYVLDNYNTLSNQITALEMKFYELSEESEERFTRIQ